MKTFLFFVICLYALSSGDCFSKYGRTCKDIGCTSNEECVMHEDPCSRFKRKDCGTYPTCQRVRTALASCNTYVCPPTQVCKVDNGQPKCISSKAGSKHKKRSIQSFNPSYTSSSIPPPHNSQTLSRTSYYSQNSNYPVNPGYNPNYASSDIYPNLPSVGQAYASTTPRYYNYPQGQTAQQSYYGQTTPRNYYGQTTQRNYYGQSTQKNYYGQTTPRANSYQTPYPTQRYQSNGYPSYPSQSSGYPTYPGYQGYPSQQGNYPSQQGRYPTQQDRYPTQQGRYPSQGNGYRDQTYSQRNYYSQNSQYPGNSQSNNLWDRFKDWGRKTIENTLHIRV